MSQLNDRYRFPSGDKITTCDICGADTTGTGKSTCDTCIAETSEEIRPLLRREKAPTSTPKHG